MKVAGPRKRVCGGFTVADAQRWVSDAIDSDPIRRTRSNLVSATCHSHLSNCHCHALHESLLALKRATLLIYLIGGGPPT